ncbi:MAG: SUMF1/EgtB/PvdO family nonheme iron enzyme [Myxococcota bacterium]
MPKKVFISYRRTDSSWATKNLYNALRSVLPEGHVFMDVDAIPLGVDFVEYLDAGVRQCDVLLAVIGPGWLEAVDPQTGVRRLENEEDFVRIEIRQALTRKIPVVPVLLDGVRMPSKDELPEDIQGLVRRMAAFIHHQTAETDIERLVRKLGLSALPNTQSEVRRPEPPSPIVRPARTPPFPVPEMVRIEPGTFWMGSDPDEPGAVQREGPKHRVQIARPFELGKYAVTFDEFDAFCRATGRDLAQDDENWGRGRRPVIRVSHEDASAYVEWLGGELGPGWRLPSEAEWEYACRAGTTGPFSFDGPISPERVNYDGNSTFEGSKTGRYRGQTVEVGTLPANPWGLHEMHGNVWEWVADCWHETYEGAPDDGSAWMEEGGGDCTGAVVRGGSWGNGPQYARSADRYRGPRDVRYSDLGFRVARTLPGRQDGKP